MSISQTNVVDTIGVDKLAGELVLAIIDHLAWGDNEHLLLLQEKLNVYLSFIESGEIKETYPNAENYHVVIHLICKYLPDNNGLAFLDKVKAVVEDAGIGFRWSKFED